jgi:hypothetical protein
MADICPVQRTKMNIAMHSKRTWLVNELLAMNILSETADGPENYLMRAKIRLRSKNFYFASSET